MFYMLVCCWMTILDAKWEWLSLCAIQLAFIVCSVTWPIFTIILQTVIADQHVCIWVIVVKPCIVYGVWKPDYCDSSWQLCHIRFYIHEFLVRSIHCSLVLRKHWPIQNFTKRSWSNTFEGTKKVRSCSTNVWGLRWYGSFMESCVLSRKR